MVITECLTMDQMGYFLSILNPALIQNVMDGVLVGYSETLWSWYPETKLWCVS